MSKQTRTNLYAVLTLLAVVIVLGGGGYLAGRVHASSLWQPRDETAEASATITRTLADDAARDGAMWRVRAEDAEAEARALREGLDSQELTVVPQVHRTRPVARLIRATYRRTPGVNRWRKLVHRYFYGRKTGKTEAALRVMRGESGGRPRAANGPCRGLFQIDYRVHRKAIARKAKAWGMKPDLYDPEFNIRFAAYMSNYGRNWSNWTVKP